MTCGFDFSSWVLGISIGYGCLLVAVALWWR